MVDLELDEVDADYNPTIPIDTPEDSDGDDGDLLDAGQSG
jgi:hypothetical protein